MSEEYYPIGYEGLAIAIVKMVAKDYKYALKRKDFNRANYLEKWFDSPWGNTLCEVIGTEGAYIIRKVKEDVADEKHRRYDRKRIKKIHREVNKKSKYEIKKHSEEKEGNESGI